MNSIWKMCVCFSLSYGFIGSHRLNLIDSAVHTSAYQYGENVYSRNCVTRKLSVSFVRLEKNEMKLCVCIIWRYVLPCWIVMTMAVCKWQRRRQRQSRLHTILATVERFSPSRNFQFSSVYSNGSILSAFNAVEFFLCQPKHKLLKINFHVQFVLYHIFFYSCDYSIYRLLEILSIRLVQMLDSSLLAFVQ